MPQVVEKRWFSSGGNIGVEGSVRAFTEEGRITSELKTEIVDKEAISHLEIVFETASGKSQDKKLYFDVGKHLGATCLGGVTKMANTTLRIA